MGLTTFHVPQPDQLPEAVVRQCYMQGIDAIPWQSKNSLTDGVLSVQRAANESGNLFVPWPVAGHGRMTLSTTCLRESPEPYILPVELARGTVGRLRNQVESWRQIGINVPAEVGALITTATAALCSAVTTQTDHLGAAAFAQDAITDALNAIEMMMRAFSEYSLTRSGKRNVFLAANLGARSGHEFPGELLGAINTGVVPFSWSEAEGNAEQDASVYFEEQVRWCRKLGLRICGGPLLDFDKNGLPDWLYLWEDDPESLQSYMLKYIENVVKKFAGKISLWHAWASLNNGQAMNLSEEQRLRIGVAALETLRTHDPTTPVFVSFNQPFGEYLSRRAMDLAPIHYADTLVRADLGVSGFGLEINLGYWPDGTLPRDVLEISRIIDRWSSLGLPLVITLSIPGPLVDDNETAEPNDESKRIIPFGDEQMSMISQARLAEQIVKACLAKPAVQGVIWNQLRDGDAPLYPYGGLMTSDGDAKPVVDSMKEIRKRYLV